MIGHMLLAAAALPTAAAADVPQTIRLQRYRAALWTVRVTVAGREGDFLFDTGGGLTLLGPGLADKAGCRWWGRTTGYDMFGKRGDGPRCDGLRLSAGNVPLEPVTAGRIDFGDRFPGSRAPDGLLSLDAFAGRALTIDQGAATLTVETPASLAERVTGATELPLRVSRSCSGICLDVFAGVPTRAGMAWLTLDTGAGGVSLIAKDYARLFGLDPAAEHQRLRFPVAPGVAVDSPVVVADMAMDGNLGQPVLGKWVMTLDLAGGRMWVKPA